MTASARRPSRARSIASRPFGMFVSFGNASGPVDAFNLGLLSQKGSLYASRPTLFTYMDQPGGTASIAKHLFKAVRQGLGEDQGVAALPARRGRRGASRAREPRRRPARWCSCP